MIPRVQVPNLLTFARVAAVPVALLVIIFAPTRPEWLFWLFVGACLTDFFDGYLARKWNVTSEIGALLDPMADKLLVALMLMKILITGGCIAPFTSYAHYFLNSSDRYFHALLTFTGGSLFIPVSIILLRELYISGLREFLASRQIALPVSKGGKWKTAMQMIGIGLVQGASAFNWGQLAKFGSLALYVAAILAIVTAWDYTKKSLSHLR